MSKVINFVKKNFEYLSYVVIIVLLLLGCFFETPMWILTFVGLLCALFFSYEQILSLYLFVFSFESIFYGSSIESALFTIIRYGMIGVIAIKYFYEVIKNKEKLNLKIIIPMSLFFIFCLLPIHNIFLKPIVDVVVVLGLAYVTYQKREKISLTRLVVFFCLGLILSGLLSFLRPYSERIISIIPSYIENKYVKFSGLFVHPNFYAMYSIISLSLLLFLKLIKKISDLFFYLLFIPIFIFGFMTISRNFILGISFAILLFVIFYIVKFKKSAFKFLSLSFVIGIAILACLNLEVRLYLVRLNIAPVEIIQDYTDTAVIDEDIYPPLDEVDEAYDYEYKSDEWWDAVYRGEIKYDPGRKGIWEMYLTDWTSSPMTILFGRGVGSKPLGKMKAHNLFLQTLWNYGIVGYVLLLSIIFSFIDLKVFKKQLKNLYFLLLLILPYYAVTMFESFTLQILFYIPLILCYNELLKEKNEVNSFSHNSHFLYKNDNECMEKSVEKLSGGNSDFNVS